MCGIVGYIGTRVATPLLIDGLKRLEYRGYDSAGVAIMNGKGVETRKVAGKISRLENVVSTPDRVLNGCGTPEQVLASIVEGINTGNLDALLTLYEPEAVFATQPGGLAHGLRGIREGLAGFIAMKGILDLEVTRVLEADGLALVVGVWSFAGTGPDGQPVTLTGANADVLRRQSDGSWRFVIDNPWGTA